MSALTTGQQVLSVGGLPLGFVPQFHTSATPMADIQGVIDCATPPALNMTLRPATYGWYAQTYPHEHFDGAQLLRIKDDVVASGAIFEPAVMPLQGWTGYTAANNSHALSIARVLKQFTDEGVEVRLRFAHEVNYYTTAEGGMLYGSGPSAKQDFKTAFAQVAQACADIAPAVRLVYSPNYDPDDSVYDAWAPPPEQYQLVAVDYYPDVANQATASDYIKKMRAFHDHFTQNSSTKMIIAETSLKLNVSAQTRIDWLRQLASSSVREAMPNLISLSWYNVLVESEYDYQIVDPPRQDDYNEPFKRFIERLTTRQSNSASRSAVPSLFRIGGAVLRHVSKYTRRYAS